MKSVVYHAPKTALQNLYVIFGLPNSLKSTEHRNGTPFPNISERNIFIKLHSTFYQIFRSSGRDLEVLAKLVHCPLLDHVHGFQPFPVIDKNILQVLVLSTQKKIPRVPPSKLKTLLPKIGKGQIRRHVESTRRFKVPGLHKHLAARFLGRRTRFIATQSRLSFSSSLDAYLQTRPYPSQHGKLCILLHISHLHFPYIYIIKFFVP